MDTASLVRSIYDAFNRRDFDHTAALFADDATTTVVPTGEVFRGPGGIRQFLNGWVAAFPDARVEVRNVIAEGERVAIEFTARGTHRGPFRTPMGALPPTGRAVDVSFCDVWAVRDGRIAAARTYFDAATFLAQLGVMEAPEAAADGPLAVSRALYDHFSRDEFDRVLDYVADDVEAVLVPFGQTFRGRDGFVGFMRGFKYAFPDLAISLTSQFADGERVTNEFTARGTHTGVLMTPAGPVPPTGRTVDFTVCEVLTVRGGKVRRLVNYQDAAALMRQLGLMPAPDGAPA